MQSPFRRLGSTISLVRLDRGRQAHLPLWGGLAAALLAWFFLYIGAEMLEGETRVVDMLLLRAAQSLRARQPWVAVVMRDFSAFGSAAVLTMFTSVTVGYLVLVRARALALLVASAVITGSIAVALLKVGFSRARPAAEFAELVAPGLSFPSGQAGNAAIVFLTLGALLASTRSRAIERTYVCGIAVLITALVGLSRIALGVHWASDVLAGWAFGSAWALVWLLLARRLAYKNAVAEAEGLGTSRAADDDQGVKAPPT
jgi:undecaprenyl-diphosphatase